MTLYDDRYGCPIEVSLFKCIKCGHITSDYHPNDEELATLYSTYYPRKEYPIENFKPLEKSSRLKMWFNGEKRAFAFVPENVTILDVGCGYGESIAYHKNRGCNAFGVEADPSVERFIKRYNLNIHIGSLYSAHHPDNFFDYVTMDQVIEHIPDIHRFMSEVGRILKPHGRLIVTTPNYRSIVAKVSGRKWINYHVPYHLHQFTRKSMRMLARSHGFALRKVKCITSSEWLLYQRIHSVTFPVKNNENLFWAGKMAEADETIQKKIATIQKQHASKIHHILTRSFDLIGQGDNFLAIMEKKDE